jgi:hypothetical protein
MKFSATGDKFENPEPGSYAAVCIRMIDMGTQESTWEGATKMAHKVKIVWELSEKMKDGRPFITSRDFTVSLHQKSTLRAFLNGWRGRDFTEEELSGFDPKVLIGKGCLLSLVQKGEYVNVASASRLPKGMEAPVVQNPTIFFSLSDFEQTEFDKLSDKIKEKIMLSPEYKSLKGKGKTDEEFSPEDDDTLAF